MTSLHDPLPLPCGQVLPNRIMKAALSEGLSDKQNSPDERLERLYTSWSQGGYGLIVTGNVMVDRTQLGEPGNVVIEDERNLDALSRWAKATKDAGVPIWVQLNHPGRQSNPLALGHTPVAPSPVALNLPGAATPRELTSAEIEDIIERFAAAAVVCETAGFDGVQIHGAHGYLVAQFLSPLSNQRNDEWGGDPQRRMRFVLEVVRRIRARVSPGFAVGIKLNSADFQRGGFTEDESRTVVAALAHEGIDMIEVSGGSYEQPAMMGKAADSTRAREAYFLEYARTVRSLAGDIPLAVTGGFRSRAAMHEAVHAGECDVIGLGRPTATTPDAADVILAGRAETLASHQVRAGMRRVLSRLVDIKSFDGILELSWHTDQLHRVGAGLTPDLNRGRIATVLAMLVATAPRPSDGSVVCDVTRYPLSDKVVLITGAGRGLGAATAAALAQRGARVVIADIDLPTAQSVAAALPRHHGLALRCDVTDLASVQESVRLSLEEFGRIDVVIANAGVLGRGGTFRTLTPDQVGGVMSVNVAGVVNTVGDRGQSSSVEHTCARDSLGRELQWRPRRVLRHRAGGGCTKTSARVRLIQQLLDQAAVEGKPLALNVLEVNRRAYALYRRLGFTEARRIVDGPAVKIRMVAST